MAVSTNDPVNPIQSVSLSGYATQKPAMVTPIPGSVITGTSATFTWTPGVGVGHYYLWVGTSVGGNNLFRYDGGTSLATSTLVTGLPANGGTIYVRLFGRSRA